MIYNSASTIPAKLYFTIVETGNYALLSDKKIYNEKVINEAWKKIEYEYNQLNTGKKEYNKVLDLSKEIEILSAREEKITLSVHYLKVIKDKDLFNLLEEEGYKYEWDKFLNIKENDVSGEEIYQNILSKIERESEAFRIKIARLEKQMPKIDDQKGFVPFDQSVLMYAAFTGLGYIDPNILPLTQYDALIVNGNKKMKALEASNKSSKTSRHGRR